MEKNIITINKKIASTTKNLEITGDIIVPDVKPDIVSVLDTNAVAYIYKDDVNNGKPRLDGNIDLYLVYLADNGEIRSISNTLNFVETFEEAITSENSILKSKVILENIEAKVLNERKISIKCFIKLQLDVFENLDIEIPNNLNSIENAEKLQETVEIKTLVGQNKIKTSIKEDIKTDNMQNIGEILSTNIEITNEENKISYNKVLAKADANVKIIFQTDDGKISKTETTIPIMSFIDIDKIKDGNICNSEYNIRNILFKINTKDNQSFTIQADFEIICEVYELKTFEIVQDIYGIKEDINYSKKFVEVQTNKIEKFEKININERVIVEDILNIYDVKTNLKIIKTIENGSYYNAEGELILGFYYEADNKSGLNIKNIKIPFVVKGIENLNNLVLKINNKKFTINGENVDCDIEILYKEKNSSIKNICIIENLEKQISVPNNEYKMTMYFVKPGDTLWEIGKKFKVYMKDIIKLNNLENPDKLEVGDRLYIMK